MTTVSAPIQPMLLPEQPPAERKATECGHVFCEQRLHYNPKVPYCIVCRRTTPAEFVPRDPTRPESRHNPSPCLARIIHKARHDDGPHSLISRTLQKADMALWRRGRSHGPWSGAEVDTMMQAFHPGRLERAWPGEPARKSAKRREYRDSVWALRLWAIRNGYLRREHDAGICFDIQRLVRDQRAGR